MLVGTGVERMVGAACAGEWIDMWDVCTWGFRCLRGTGSEEFGTVLRWL